jgi:hypothetical protein
VSGHPLGSLKNKNCMIKNIFFIRIFYLFEPDTPINFFWLRPESLEVAYILSFGVQIACLCGTDHAQVFFAKTGPVLFISFFFFFFCFIPFHLQLYFFLHLHFLPLFVIFNPFWLSYWPQLSKKESRLYEFYPRNHHLHYASRVTPTLNLKGRILIICCFDNFNNRLLNKYKKY